MTLFKAGSEPLVKLPLTSSSTAGQVQHLSSDLQYHDGTGLLLVRGEDAPYMAWQIALSGNKA